MATVAYSSTYWYATTADFRAWGLELSNAMQTAGLVKESTVTGQINWATVNAPGTINTVAGYEVYRFNDALQATAPVFIKIEYGFAAALSVPTMWITVATTTTTTGNLGGVMTARVAMGTIVGLSQQFRPLLTNICVLPGYVAVLHKRDATNNGYFPNCAHFFAVCRTVDDAGNNTGDGVMVFNSHTALNTSPYAQCLGFTPGFPYVSSYHPGYAFMPYNLTTTNLGANDVQIFKTFGVFPQVRPNPYVLIYLRDEMPENTIMKAAMQGSTIHNYLAAGLSLARAGWWATGTDRALAFRYQ